MVSTYNIQVLTLVAAFGCNILLGIIACILFQMNAEQKGRDDVAAEKTEEVKMTLEKSNELVAKDSTLQELKDKAVLG